MGASLLLRERCDSHRRYFKGPDGMIFEYSVGVDEIEDESTHRPRQFGFEPTSFCMWGSKPAGMTLPNK